MFLLYELETKYDLRQTPQMSMVRQEIISTTWCKEAECSI